MQTSDHQQCNPDSPSEDALLSPVVLPDGIQLLDFMDVPRRRGKNRAPTQLQAWETTFSALSSLTGQDLSGRANKWLQYNAEIKSTHKKPLISQAEQVLSELLKPKRTDIIICIYNSSCCAKIESIADFRAHLISVHGLTDNDAGRKDVVCRYPTCDASPDLIRWSGGLLSHVVSMHSGLELRCRQCGSITGMGPGCLALLKSHLVSPPDDGPKHFYFGEDDCIVYYDEICVLLSLDRLPVP